MVKKSIYVRRIVPILIAAIVIAIFISGCEEATVTSQREKFSSVKVEHSRNFYTVGTVSKSAASDAQEGVIETSKSYLEAAYLDLISAKSDSYQSDLLSFISEDSFDRFKVDWHNLSLGGSAGGLKSIEEKKLKVPYVTVQFDKSKKPKLGTFQYILDVKYKKDNKTMKLNTYGWLVLEKQGNDWKIFDYYAKQHIGEG
ncbi:MAG: hypothetical protein E3J54_03725 [Actinobacteria bacterium]|nr:MAG: hypothetical protein E3J54_03725 [Actinomycetota bacterium]